uniref:NADH dehydrogenase [ubiquinone] 1 alpha subcomplex subunit 13 n=1 Tax=Aureoumbra lagunensis TaxID=44058 RepID=A0A7S3NKY2_9STRA|mmetsp:Transcript_9102/g.14017  ORF Transcript_9102/g.14017 Transcript_9102/m.14017 type:complete len:170 (-) Transcript_9102:298-807(-)
MTRMCLSIGRMSARSLMAGSRARRMGTGSPLNIVAHDLKKPIQDMPPEGGYPKITVANENVSRGPPGWALWLGAVVTISFGYYQVGMGNRQRNAAKREKRCARLSFAPYLQAEEDVRYHAHLTSKIEDEAKIMNGVKGWKVGESVYNNRDHWIPPTPLLHPRLDAQAKF